MKNTTRRWVVLFSVISFNVTTISLALWFLTQKYDKYGETEKIPIWQYIVGFIVPTVFLIPCCVYVKRASTSNNNSPAQGHDNSESSEDNEEVCGDDGLGAREVTIDWESIGGYSRSTSISIISSDTGLRLILNNPSSATSLAPSRRTSVATEQTTITSGSGSVFHQCNNCQSLCLHNAAQMQNAEGLRRLSVTSLAPPVPHWM